MTTEPPGGTTTAPPPPPVAGPVPGPPGFGDRVRELEMLRRTRSGRTVGGVCSGLGRHFDIDPTLVKVLFVVLALFGGIGVLLYAAMWLLVPADGADRGVIATGHELRRVLLLVAAAITVLAILGQTGRLWYSSLLPLGIVAIVVVAFLAGRRQSVGAAPVPPAETPTWTPPVDAPAPGDASTTMPMAATPTWVATDPVPPAPRPTWAPPRYTPPAQRRPRRTGLLLLWPTLALIAVGLGALGVYDAGHHVVQAAYPALALAITGLMLVVGAFKGRPGGLTLVGLLAALLLLANSATGGFHGARRLDYTPQTAAAVASGYRLDTGELSLNLSEVGDLRALDGRTVSIRGGTGAVTVIVPRGLEVRVASRIRVGGGLSIDNRDGGGAFSYRTTQTIAGPAGAPRLDLDIDIRIGQIIVRHPDE